MQREVLAFLSAAGAGDPWVDWSDIENWFSSRFFSERNAWPLEVVCYERQVMNALLNSGRIQERRCYLASSDPRDPDYAGWYPQYAPTALG